jgi:prepilin-type N-terminal cleavage/methylation domain-containing protein
VKKNKTLKINGFTLVELVCVMAIFAMILFGALAMVGPVSRLFKNTTKTEASRAAMLSMTGYLEGTLRNANRVQMYVGFNSFDEIKGSLFTDNNGTPIDSSDDTNAWLTDIDADQRQADTYGLPYWNTLDNTKDSGTNSPDYWNAMERLGVIGSGDLPETVETINAVEYFRDYFYLDNTTTLISTRQNDNYDIETWLSNKLSTKSHIGTGLNDYISAEVSRSDVDKWLATGNHGSGTGKVAGEFNIYVLGIEDGRMRIKTFENDGETPVGGSDWKDVVNPAYYDAYDYRIVFGEPATEVQNAARNMYKTRHDNTGNIVWNNLVNEFDTAGNPNANFTADMYYPGPDGKLDVTHGGATGVVSTDDIEIPGATRGLSPNVNSTFYNTDRFAVSVFAKPKPTTAEITNNNIPQFNVNMLNTGSFKLKAVGNQSMSATVEPENDPQEEIRFGIKQDGVKLDFSSYDSSFISGKLSGLTKKETAKADAKKILDANPAFSTPYNFGTPVDLSIASMHDMLDKEGNVNYKDIAGRAIDKNYFSTYDGFKSEWLHLDKRSDVDNSSSTEKPNNDRYIYWKEAWLRQEWKGFKPKLGDTASVTLRNRKALVADDGDQLIKVTRYREYVNPNISIDEADPTKTASAPTEADMILYNSSNPPQSVKEKVETWAALNDTTFNTANTSWNWKQSLRLATSETVPDPSYASLYTRPYSTNMYIVFTLPKEYYS